MFSKTTDGGVTWSQGRPIFDPGEKNQTIGNQIVVPTTGPATGVLIDGFSLILTKGGKGNNQRASFGVAVIRSTDGGATWSQPIIVSDQQVASVSIAGQDVRSSDFLPEFAAAPDDTLYAAWQDRRFSPTGASKMLERLRTNITLSPRIATSTGLLNPRPPCPSTPMLWEYCSGLATATLMIPSEVISRQLSVLSGRGSLLRTDN